MDTIHSQPLTEDEIHALVDHQLSPEALAELQARLTLDPLAQATVVKWQQQRAALRDLHWQTLTESVPVTLTNAARQTAAAQQTFNQSWRWGGIAAGMVLAFGVGWFSNLAWQNERSLPSPSLAQTKARVTADFVRQASFAYQVYSPELRHPVEVTAAQQDHLVQWLSKRVGRPLKVPNLLAQGYELVGGRLLPGEAGARAQFMFQNAAGTRITLYLGALDKSADGMLGRATSFEFAIDAPVPSFYWIDQGFGYALTGPVPRDVLMTLVQAVYHQL